MILIAPIGVGANLVISIRVGDQTSSTTIGAVENSFSYRAPHVFSVEPNHLTTLGCILFESAFDWEKRVSREVRKKKQTV